MTRNIRLTLAYDGGAYAGWQVQPDRPTIQRTVEEAIWSLTGERVSLLAAGRTDAGVHALGQVANFRTASPIPPQKWRPALQSKLPPDIVIRDSREVPLDFHATFAAKSKRYRYLIRHSIVDDPFLRRYCWRLGGELDVPAMNVAAQCLVGTHDFRSFESHWPNTSTSVRTMTRATAFRTSAWLPWSVPETADPARDSGPFVCFEIDGNGFLYNMVRAIVGTLANVGRGTWTADDFRTALAAGDRRLAGETAPPQGLYLVSVTY
ncbi:MAG: tRNA pseudouridine(38-40) synthase TruA [Planctomyces sp.]|nr:tRNA pseudouridine(38-40) synthase TruA [Planctomyces sp.]